MNYYKMTKIPKNKYVVGYEIKNGIIIMKFANNEKYVVKNTIANENRILERMNKQVSLVINNKRIMDHIFIYGLGTISFCIFGYHTIFSIRNLINGIITLNKILFVIFSIASMLYIAFVIKCFNKEKQDLKKIKLYCETKELLNNNMKKNGRNIIQKSNIKEEMFTINFINNLSLKDLEVFKDNIEKDKNLEAEDDQIVYKTKAKRKN